MDLYAPNEFDQNFFMEIANIFADNTYSMVAVGGEFKAVQEKSSLTHGDPETITK